MYFTSLRGSSLAKTLNFCWVIFFLGKLFFFNGWDYLSYVLISKPETVVLGESALEEWLRWPFIECASIKLISFNIVNVLGYSNSLTVKTIGKSTR